MNIITIENAFAYDKATAVDMLHGFGMDDADIETLKDFIVADELEDARDGEAVWKQEYQAMEAHAEALQSAMNEVLNMLDDALNMERISKARERMEAMRNVLYNA